MNNPNQEPQKPSIHEVNGAFLELEEYNRQHTGTAVAMGNLLSVLLEQDDFVEADGKLEDSQRQSKNRRVSVDVSAEAEIAESIMKFTSLPTLQRIGLEIKGIGGDIGNDESSLSLQRQELVLSDVTLYESFLNYIDGQLYGEESSAIRDEISSVYNNIFTATEAAILSDDEEDNKAGSAGLGLLKRLNPSYEKLLDQGIDIQYEKIAKLVAWEDKPELKDMLIAEKRLGMGNDDESFNSSRWQVDTTGETLTERWSKLLSHYEKVKAKYGEDSSLTELMKFEINQSLTTAQKYMDENFKEEKDELGRPEAFAQISNRAKELGLAI